MTFKNRSIDRFGVVTHIEQWRKMELWLQNMYMQNMWQQFNGISIWSYGIALRRITNIICVPYRSKNPTHNHQ